MLEDLGGQRGALRPRLEALEQDVSRLKDWASGLGEKRAQLRSSQASLRDAVGRIEERTSAIATDFANKVCRVVLIDGCFSEWRLNIFLFCPIKSIIEMSHFFAKSQTIDSFFGDQLIIAGK